jgi:LuxR family transcriptional regulator, maltose regulon positive regulatory protein
MVQAQQPNIDDAFPARVLLLPVAPGDPAREGRALVRSLTVSRILAGAGNDVVQQVIEQKELAESEPLLLAGAALAHSWIEIAELALGRASSELAEAAEPEVTDVLSLALLNMAMSKLRDEPDIGLAQARHVKELMAKLAASERALAPELPSLIDYYVAGFELLRGNVATARWTLERGAGRFRQWRDADATDAEQLVRAACVGQLAWLDAFCGDLRRAMRYAGCLLTDRQADTGEIGVKFAHLATAWTHMEHGETEQAQQRLDHAMSTASDTVEPVLAAAERLTEARLAIVTDEPETALRLLQAIVTIDVLPSGWFADQFAVATAEAWLAAGEPQQAIAALGPEPEPALAEARLVLVRALRLSADFEAAEHVLARVPSDVVEMPLISQVKRSLLAAELAVERGDRKRSELLVDHALRTAVKEQLRSTVGSAGSWLRAFVTREPDLSDRYSTFVASVPQLVRPAPVTYARGDAASLDVLITAPLTKRETDVLIRLAEFCTNEEIADELVLSLNTVKTHMRSLFQKLSVTRRADAVRRGRALGLC